MDKDDFASLRRAIAQVDDYRRGQRIGFVAHEPVKAIRASMQKGHRIAPAACKN